MAIIQYPNSPQRPIIETIHGEEVIDNYRWLEDDENSEVKTWVDSQNELTSKLLTENTNVGYFKKKLTEAFDVVDIGVPVKYGNRYFWHERQSNENQRVLYFKEGIKGKPQCLIDPNKLSEDGITTLDYTYISKDAKLIAYGLSEAGSEMSTLYVLDVDTGKNLADIIPYARYSSIAWLPDSSGFFYTRNPKPGAVPKDEEHLHQKLYLHMLGEDPSKDKMIFGKNRPKDDMIGLSLSVDGRSLAIRVAQNWNRNDVFLFDTKTEELKPVMEGLDAQFGFRLVGDDMVMKTNYGADNYRIVRAPLVNLPENINDWEVLIAESEYVIDGFSVTKDKLLVFYIVDATDSVKIYDHKGEEVGELPLPDYGSIAGITARQEEEEFFFGVTTFVSPKTIYRYEPSSDEYATYQETETKYEPSDFVVKREWTKSKDGTDIPAFIIHKQTIKQTGNNPTVLYGYGCHGISQFPSYLKGWMPWLEAGGIFSLAIIRGGGEYGEKWHRDGSMDKKQNTFDDFIAAAEYLIDVKYTDPEHLGIQGGSNGGLMVGAVMTQRPKLMKAVICQVPVLDMARFHKFLIAGRWVHEFGDPEKPDEFKWLMKWSPYHNTKQDVEYPATFFITANHDTRVAPLHARKMTALLQNTNRKNPILLRTEMDAGHGAGKPKKKIIEAQAERSAFMAWHLGLT